MRAKTEERPTASVGEGFRSLTTERLEAEIKTFAAHLAAGECRWLLMLAEYDCRKAYEDWDCVSIEQWLSIHTSMSRTTARAHMAVARRLGELPLITAAFGEGRLTYSKVRALARVATPENESEWLSTARHATAEQLERLTGDVRRVAIASQHGTAAQQVDERSLSFTWTDNGMLRLTALLTPEVGARLVSLLRAELDAQADANRADESDRSDQLVRAESAMRTAMPPVARESLAARTADAFGAVLERVVDTSAVTAAAVTDAPRALVVVHRELDGTVRVEGGPPIPNEVVEQLECDAETVDATHTEEGIAYGKRRRSANAALRRHIRTRDRCCAVPGCGSRYRLQQHHIRHYAHGGETSKVNLVLLCGHHHACIHRRGWTITGSPEDATLRFTDASGRPVGFTDACEGDADCIVEIDKAAGIDPTPDTAAAIQMGEPYDHELAVWIYANRPDIMRYPAPRRCGALGASAEAPATRADSAEPAPSIDSAEPHPASAEAHPDIPIDQCFVFDEQGNFIRGPVYADDAPIDVEAFIESRCGTGR